MANFTDGMKAGGQKFIEKYWKDEAKAAKKAAKAAKKAKKI